MLNIKILFFAILFCSFARGQFIIDPYKYAVAGAVFDGQNAADPTNEVNGVANTNDNTGETTITSSATTPQDGSYCLRFQNNGGGSKDGNITLVGVSNGDDVTITFYLKQVTGLAWTTKLLSGDWDTTYTQNPDDGESGNWEQLTFASATAQTDDPDLVIRTTSGGSDLDLADVDNIVITINWFWWIIFMGNIKKLHKECAA